MVKPKDPLGAFMDYPPVPVESAPDGPLKGLTLAVKDLYDVKGYPTGFGHPGKVAAARPADANAPIVQALLDAGASFAGKTLCDELCFSLNGENYHYGTPRNSKAPDRIPGGSSSGSASAVAGGAVDLALGSDTGGSVRGPASFCGLYGIRPTYGRTDLSRATALAPSFDTAGWFARDAGTFAKAAPFILGDDTAKLPDPLKPALLEDTLALMEDDPREAFVKAAARLEAVLGPLGRVDAAPDGFDKVLTAFRHHQGYEIWQTHGTWITEEKPTFGPGIAERLQWTGTLTDDQLAAARTVREAVRRHLTALAGRHGILVLPTMPAIAPLKNTPVAEIETFRNRALSLLALAGLSGLPQLSIPMAEYDGAPLGVSLMAPHGTDRALVDLAVRIADALDIRF